MEGTEVSACCLRQADKSLIRWSFDPVDDSSTYPDSSGTKPKGATNRGSRSACWASPVPGSRSRLRGRVVVIVVVLLSPPSLDNLKPGVSRQSHR